MADYSTSAANAANAINNITSGGLVESYTIGNGTRSVTMTPAVDLVKVLPRLEGLAARRSGGLFKLAKPQEPSP